ncbi:MAG TPA: hypothetical protein VN782_13810 [Usitatibacter sp.]|nr:hypothetical protein [Usitatibacter sp.]
MRLVAAILALAAWGAAAATDPALALVDTIPLPGVKGRIDHFATDGRRIFIAALGNDTVEVLDLESGQHRSLSGFREPQGIVSVADTHRIFVANGEGDRVDVLDAASLETIRRIERMPDADNARYLAADHAVAVGYGNGKLRFLDAASGEPLGGVPLPGHPESFQAESRGKRIFVNVPSARAVVVVDRAKRVEIARWPLAGASANYPMALDERHGRLFVGTRAPAKLLVYDIGAGREVGRVTIGRDVDDLFFDDERERVYAICGEGRIDVIAAGSPARYEVQASVSTAHGARTGLFVPERHRLYVAAPATGEAPARILVYATR